MTTCTPGLPVSERTLRVFGHHRPSKKGASLRKEGQILAERIDVSSVFHLYSHLYPWNFQRNAKNLFTTIVPAL
jgi:hypothetical protein